MSSHRIRFADGEKILPADKQLRLDAGDFFLEGILKFVIQSTDLTTDFSFFRHLWILLFLRWLIVCRLFVLEYNKLHYEVNCAVKKKMAGPSRHWLYFPPPKQIFLFSNANPNPMATAVQFKYRISRRKGMYRRSIEAIAVIKNITLMKVTAWNTVWIFFFISLSPLSVCWFLLVLEYNRLH